jgi:hypothetical protein
MTAFRNILILLENADSSVATVEKVKELCEVSETNIHLVHIVRKDSLPWAMVRLFTGNKKRDKDRLDRKKSGKFYLNSLKNKIRETDTSLQIISSTQIKKGGSRCLEKYIAEEHIDLVVSTENSKMEDNYILIEPFYANLFKQTGVPVLNFFQEAAGYSAKSIVLPVSGSFPEKSILAVLEIARQFGAHIHIIAILDENKAEMKQKVDNFYLTYKTLSEYGHRPHYKIVLGKEKMAILLGYAKNIKAGMMLINANHDTTFSARLKRKLSEMLHPLSGMQVLTMKLCFG